MLDPLAELYLHNQRVQEAIAHQPGGVVPPRERERPGLGYRLRQLAKRLSHRPAHRPAHGPAAVAGAPRR